ncbi:pectinesterase family protein [Leadbetterella byssophila]|uniref:pectinesterase family protein n=1 Tax=Leadbetterella byssophila TaxID=316068 RepID=UPI0039A2B39A
METKMAIKLLLLILLAIPTLGQDADFVVAKDGSGDFLTVQEAINAVPDFRKKRTIIFIKPGVYKEKIVLAESKSQVTLLGTDPTVTILTFDDYATKPNRFGEEMGTTGSSSFYAFGEGFVAKNITFQNTAGPVGQAVAIWVKGDKSYFENCRFLGFQDTLYTYGKESRQYYKNCYIEGTVDFIFGSSIALFENCEIFCKGKGYITAASTPQWRPYGYVFKNCIIKGEEKESHYLGRPWRPYARVVFLDSELSEVIKPEGWDNWRNPENEKTAFFAELGNRGSGAKTDKRVAWARKKLEKGDFEWNKIFGDWTLENQ